MSNEQTLNEQTLNEQTSNEQPANRPGTPPAEEALVCSEKLSPEEPPVCSEKLSPEEPTLRSEAPTPELDVPRTDEVKVAELPHHRYELGQKVFILYDGQRLAGVVLKAREFFVAGRTSETRQRFRVPTPSREVLAYTLEPGHKIAEGMQRLTLGEKPAPERKGSPDEQQATPPTHGDPQNVRTIPVGTRATTVAKCAYGVGDSCPMNLGGAAPDLVTELVDCLNDAAQWYWDQEHVPLLVESCVPCYEIIGQWREGEPAVEQIDAAGSERQGETYGMILETEVSERTD